MLSFKENNNPLCDERFESTEVFDTEIPIEDK